MPQGATFTTRQERDSSTTIVFYMPGFGQYTWNSGMFITCFLLGNGFGIMAGTLSRSPKIGALTNFLVSRGCKSVMTDINEQSNGDDGDG
ncbi:hypothetical protein [Burkholderia sp. F1]|uniref:hypothetical protein n=1 Tax=Burkholderia sp. F1 TaxID=3366817 RepID=UPI003D75EC54